MNVYRSILEKRNKPVSRVDFRDAYSLTVSDIECPDLIGEEELHWWNAHIPVPPQELRLLFSMNFQDPIELDVHPRPWGVKISVASLDENAWCDGRLFEGNALFFMDGGRHKPDSTFRVDQKSQGRGIGKSWMKSLIECGVMLGQSDFRFLAGYENGAYSWSRLGASLDMSRSMGTKRELFSDRVIARLDAMQDYVSRMDYKIMRPLARMESADNYAAMTEFDRPLPRDLAREFESADAVKSFEAIRVYAEQKKDKNIIKTTPGAFARAELNNIKEAFDAAAYRNVDATLVQCLYANTVAPATIDFSNARQMERIGSYVGGWSAIAPS